MVTEQMARVIISLINEPYKKRFQQSYEEANETIIKRMGGDELCNAMFIYIHWEPIILYGKEIWRESHVCIEARAEDCAINMCEIVKAEIIGDRLKLTINFDDELILKIKG